MRRTSSTPWGAVWLTLALASCQEEEPAVAPEGPKPHVVLISIDTLRPDHMGLHGYHRDTTPRLDAFAQEAVAFERAYTPSPNTIVAHASMLTSLYPVTHGVLPDVRLTEQTTTLAESLKAAGYETAAFLEHKHWLSEDKGFAQGFDTFDSEYRSADENNALVFDWLDAHQASPAPKFLFVHYYDVHSDFTQQPYHTGTEFDDRFVEQEPSSGFDGCRDGFCGSLFLHAVNRGDTQMSDEELGWAKALYDGGLAYTDDRVGQVLDRLRELGWLDNAWVVITSDHAEEFREHGRLLHSQPYCETARIPMLIRPPGGTAHRMLSDPVNLVDVVPTLLEGVGLTTEALLQGRSLQPLLRGESLPEAPMYFHELRDPENVSVRSGGFTLITRDQFAQTELYELAADPLETTNVADRHPERLAALLEQLREFYAAQLLCRDATGDGLLELSDEEVEQLRALGYVNVRSRR